MTPLRTIPWTKITRLVRLNCLSFAGRWPDGVDVR